MSVDYRKLVATRNLATKLCQNEASITAWMTSLLFAEGLLFHKFTPQTISSSKRCSASEYDFASLERDGISILLELKSPKATIPQLEEALFQQVVPYAESEKLFTKGVLISTNGHIAIRQSMLSYKKNHYALGFPEQLSLHDIASLRDFRRLCLAPAEKEIDGDLTRGFRATDLIRITQKATKHSRLWVQITEALRDVNGWSTRK